ncbi:MAG: hypothetical protein KDA31_09430 [Phycisphaerales bacterium]|nr:hypothetical protein [Phycisphaerales bacterium]MCB9836467.1 hypothetical protein [Phycisphaera sp.]
MTSRTDVRPTRLILCALLALFTFSSTGCNYLGPIIFFIEGPPKIEAEYKLPKERTAVVLVDDPRSQIPRRAIRVAMIEAAEQDILRKSLVKDLVSGQSALRVAQSDQSAGQMSVAEIGRAVEAEIVIWATVDSFTRADVARSQEPAVAFRVRVVDATNNEILWPGDSSGHPLVVTLTPRIGTVASDAGASTASELKLAQNAGQAIGQLFYQHLVREHLAE